MRGEWARSFAQRGAQRQPNLRPPKPRKPRETFVPLLFQERCRHIFHAMLPTLLPRTTLLSLLLVLACATSSRAEQFVLFDVTFPFTKADADNAKPSQSHYYVKGEQLNAQRPKDWTAPVDYRNGTVHVRLEVIEKPAGSEPTQWSVCDIPNKGQNHGYGCIGTDTYKEKGVYEKDIPMTKFWQNDDIVWSEGISK